MTIGKKIQNAIKGKGMSMEEAAEKLGMTRQTLYNSILRRGEIDESILQTVITKLGIQLQSDKEDSENENEKNQKIGGYQAKYIALLEKTLQEREKEIGSLKTDILEIKRGVNELQSFRKLAEDNHANLNEVSENQKALYATLDILQEQTLKYFAEMKLPGEQDGYLDDMRREKLSRYLRSLREGIRIDTDS